ncbi:MAG: phosphodiester glycosidase family protein [Bacteroidales bacterium]
MRLLNSKIFLYSFLIINPETSQAQSIQWQKIDNGLFLTEVTSPLKSDFGDSKIIILRIDPKYYEFKLISAKEKNEPNITAKEWSKTRGLIAVVNAGMYQSRDNKTHVGYMRNYDFVNNGQFSKDNTVIAFNRKDTAISEFQIIDLKCQNWEELKDKYNSYTQCIRMIDCNQNNTWSQQTKKFSMTIIAKDKSGNAMFIFTRSPYSVYDFINILLSLPLNIYNAMFLEGGPEASFYFNYKGLEVEKFGSFETGYQENDNVTVASEIPNIIGIVKKN